MARILAVSSFLAHGLVGLMANAAVFNVLGLKAVQFPTIILSNHPGHARTSGAHVEPARLGAMLDAIENNGWLGSIDAVLTGYLPSAEHVAFARDAVMRVRKHNANAIYVCDPILGDDPEGIYLDERAAHAIKDNLVPLADLATPNRFELSWLTGRTVNDIDSAASAAAELACKAIAATSIPQGTGEISNVLVAQATKRVRTAPRHENVPHGTGDVFCGLLTGLLAQGLDLIEAFDRADKTLHDIAKLSSGREDLDLAPVRRIA
ncbi:MAG: bifunctional hydroxymethylpyrimidine kinase/phosphomethylpyrimidine kinase [Hyphomicrobiaceae bacterium]|nr:bifunctional hydroxymethylpyrimidine kinase/phosphomethylpyrimidine kinase [Hyphomicrobiaceae bacterium]